MRREANTRGARREGVARIASRARRGAGTRRVPSGGTPAAEGRGSSWAPRGVRTRDGERDARPARSPGCARAIPRVLAVSEERQSLRGGHDGAR